jgi:hypothetical protein
MKEIEAALTGPTRTRPRRLRHATGSNASIFIEHLRDTTAWKLGSILRAVASACDAW